MFCRYVERDLKARKHVLPDAFACTSHLTKDFQTIVFVLFCL